MPKSQAEIYAEIAANARRRLSVMSPEGAKPRSPAAPPPARPPPPAAAPPAAPPPAAPPPAAPPPVAVPPAAPPPTAPTRKSTSPPQRLSEGSASSPLARSQRLSDAASSRTDEEAPAEEEPEWLRSAAAKLEPAPAPAVTLGGSTVLGGNSSASSRSSKSDGQVCPPCDEGSAASSSGHTKSSTAERAPVSPAPQHSQTLRRPPSERALRRFELLQRNRPCPSPGCNFRVTWHDTHCCNRCASGRGHGTHCDRDTVPSPSELDEQSHYDDLSMGFSATSELEEALDAKEEELQVAKQTAMAYIQELLGEKKELHAERRRLIARLKNLESGEQDAEAARRREEEAARQRREVRTALEGKAEAEERRAWRRRWRSSYATPSPRFSSARRHLEVDRLEVASVCVRRPIEPISAARP